MGEKGVRITLVVVDVFAAVSAIVGAVGLLAGFMDIPSSVLRTTPFADFAIPALLLGVVVGGSALVAAVIAVVEPLVRIEPLQIAQFESLGIGALASAVAGCIMVGWMTVELEMIGLGSWLQPTYLAVGLLMIGLAGLLQWDESRQAAVSALPHAA
jgi:hypothetical protein